MYGWPVENPPLKLPREKIALLHLARWQFDSLDFWLETQLQEHEAIFAIMRTLNIWHQWLMMDPDGTLCERAWAELSAASQQAQRLIELLGIL